MTTEAQKRQFGRQICAIAAGHRLTREEAREGYRQVILNEQPELQQGAFLMAHITRGPTAEELSGAWDALDQFDTAKVTTTVSRGVCDIVGTGSDALKTVNCSTPAALIVAGCGLPVAKKGARLVTGVSGASDILEILGVDLSAPLERAGRCLDDHGICYLPGEAFLRTGWARLIQSMRFTSAFNIIGPLTRPCDATDSIVIGGYRPEICDQLVAVLDEIGMPSALAPYGMVEGVDPDKGMDEFSPCGPTRVVELRKGQRQTYTVTPMDFGIRPVNFGKIASRDGAQGNADVVSATLRGQYDTPLGDFFCMNAAAALYAAGRADSLTTAMDQAKQALAQGAAWSKLQALVEYQGQE